MSIAGSSTRGGALSIVLYLSPMQIHNLHAAFPRDHKGARTCRCMLRQGTEIPEANRYEFHHCAKNFSAKDEALYAG